MAKVELKKKPNSGKFLTGMNCQLYINGQKIPTATKFDLSIDARGVAKATVELFVTDLVVDGDIKVKKVKKNGKNS